MINSGNDFGGKPAEAPKVSRVRLMQASKAAENAWLAEVEAVLGVREASLARYQGRANGAPGSRMNDLYNRFIAAQSAYTAG
jgi:hypothetical protein